MWLIQTVLVGGGKLASVVELLAFRAELPKARD